MTGEMSVMDGSGDTKLLWDSDNEDEVEAAKATFDRLVKKGFVAFSVKGKQGEKGEKVTKFDPSAERLILVPMFEKG